MLKLYKYLNLNAKNTVQSLLMTLLMTVMLMPAHANVIVTGVLDGPLMGGQPKTVELFVTADVADLSIYGLGSANNGNGTGGEEFTFPAGAYTAGTFIYVASDSMDFSTYFGFFPDFVTDDAVNVNGDEQVGNTLTAGSIAKTAPDRTVALLRKVTGITADRTH